MKIEIFFIDEDKNLLKEVRKILGNKFDVIYVPCANGYENVADNFFNDIKIFVSGACGGSLYSKEILLVKAGRLKIPVIFLDPTDQREESYNQKLAERNAESIVSSVDEILSS